MQRTVYADALARAAEVLGGADALRAYLRVPMSSLVLWIEGFVRPPGSVFLQVVELLNERDLRDLQETMRPRPD